MAAAALLGLLAFGPKAADAQLATVGGGALFTEGSTEAVGELHVSAPALVGSFRPYATLSWTTRSWSPTIITAAERTVLETPISSTGLGGGAVWFDVDGYEAYPLAVSTTVIPLAAPRTSMVVIGSTQPFQDFSWSVVAKIGVAILGGG